MDWLIDVCLAMALIFAVHGAAEQVCEKLDEIKRLIEKPQEDEG